MIKFCLFLILIIQISFSQIPDQIPKTNILYRVFRIKYGEFAGTSFTLEDSSRQYLITAKHVLNGIQPKDSVYIMLNHKQWVKIFVRPIWCKPDTVDIIALAPEERVSVNFPMVPSSAGVDLGQDVYFFGYPFNMKTEMSDTVYPFPIAAIRKGILSSADIHDGYQIMNIDGTSDHGFSGGPVVFTDLNTKQQKICAVISSRTDEYDTVYQGLDSVYYTKKKIPTKYFIEKNAGFISAYNIEPVLEAIRKNPIGPIVK